MLDQRNRFSLYLLTTAVTACALAGCGNDNIYKAAGRGDTRAVAAYLGRGADINKRSGGVTLLDGAAINGKPDIVRFLLQKGADPNVRNQQGRPPVYYAIIWRHPDVVKLFVESGMNLHVRDNYGETLLHLASQGDASDVRLLVGHGLHVNVLDKSGDTPLFSAAATDNAPVAAELIKLGAHVTARSINGWTPLHVAAFSDSVRVASLLISHGGQVNARNVSGWTPLHFLAGINYDDCGVSMAKLLLSNGAKVNALDKQGRTPRQLAKEQGNDKLAKFLAAHGGR